ncbi:MAG: sigma 54-interacting transcriptional regulator [Nitrospiraceae bacterium]
MALFSEKQHTFARALGKLARCNPFLPERIEAEREALGPEFVAAGPVWHARADRQAEHPNLRKINDRAQALAEELRARLHRGIRAVPEDVGLYEEIVLYLLYNRYEDDLYQLIAERRVAAGTVDFYTHFHDDLERYLTAPGRVSPAGQEPAHVFALFFQIRRAFHFIFRNIIGGSLPAARLRAAVWQSIFTHDLIRYRRSLYARMGDIPTLIAGPSGTGKELVAQAIGLSRYIPFDAAKRTFQTNFGASFHALNLSALPPTLIESELFGHKRGAFTGAVQDRVGWLETCSPLGTVFLDEIAEVDVAIQVKLLRVLEARTFQRVGEAKERLFQGKLVAATNRDLGTEMRAGRFREDLYYRLCADLVQTPLLQARLCDSPQELHDLLLFLAQRLVGEAEVEALTHEAEEWITKHLGRGYQWPGNVRELEQCLRNVMIRGEYRQPRRAASMAHDSLVQRIISGSLTTDELMRSYCTLSYARTGSYLETARRLRLDRRTVKEKIDVKLLERLRAEFGTQTNEA